MYSAYILRRMNCKNCATMLEFLPNYTHVNYDNDTDIQLDVYKCPICDFICYNQDGNFISEFSFNFAPVAVKMLVSDQELEKMKIRERELVKI